MTNLDQLIPKSAESASMNGFVNEIRLPGSVLESMDAVKNDTILLPLPEVSDSAIVAKDLLTAEETISFSNALASVDWIPVGINGMRGGFDRDKDPVGSYRASYYSQELANIFWQRIGRQMPRERIMTPTTPTDWDDCTVWRPVGVNPLMRFIEYRPGGFLVPHYDAPYIYNHEKRTLMSLVLYIHKSSDIDGGATRFLHDAQTALSLSERDYRDWPIPPDDSQIRAVVEPSSGDAIIFDHRLLHDGQLVKGTGTKLLLRTDIDFERCE